MNRSFPTLCAAVGLAAAGVLLVGCGAPGALHPAGAVPTAVAPARLWPELPPPPTRDPLPTRREVVSGVIVPGGDLHNVNPADIVKAQTAAHPHAVTGADALDEETAAAIGKCAMPGIGACPILKAYYRDLTGEGKDDLIVGIRMPEHQLAIRVYTMDQGNLTEIMGTSEPAVSVQLAGGELMIRTTSELSGYDLGTVWAYDSHQHAMIQVRNETIRLPNTSTPQEADPTPGPATSPDAATPSPAFAWGAR
ncbi:hypothetical protein [Streptomyces sp. NPDC093097]|uniref:hypothetical protein n=1 Tax=Streptomyces sp. NPDC093097 TaxID=3366027 RepID=UPI0038161328